MPVFNESCTCKQDTQSFGVARFIIEFGGVIVTTCLYQYYLFCATYLTQLIG